MKKKEEHMGIRIGLDIGIASVGWAVVDDDYNIIESGANIFNEAKAASNVDRRTFRQTKRLLRRQKTRLRDFDILWINAGLDIPKEKVNKQLQFRVQGMTMELSENELYAALKNMLKHRGISYLEDALDEEQSGKSIYEKGLQVNQKALKCNKMPCEIQYARLMKYGSYRGHIEVKDESGEEMILSNIFTLDAYCKEAKKILECQKQYHSFITESFEEDYLTLLRRKRKYYEGPGNELSRTDYGKYTTKLNPETGEYVTEENIFEKLIGKCSVYPKEMRASAASYTAQIYNMLNDLNNLTINGRKLEYEEKKSIVDEIQKASSVNMLKIIKKVINEDITTIEGARKDKNDKEIFHKMETYNKMRHYFEKNGLDFKKISTDDLDKIGNILTLNTEKEAILEAFNKSQLELSQEEKDAFIEIRKKNGSLFNKWHSFSLKIMKELIPELYLQSKNQMQLLTDMGVFKKKSEIFQNYEKIPTDVIIEDIYNPVVKRSIRITVKIVNALIKKYGYPREVVIEMPRDRNSDEEKKRIQDEQKKNDTELKKIIEKVESEYGIKITDTHFRNHKNLRMKLRLWHEQDGRCLYSGKVIGISELLNDCSKFEIDHVIPKSISFDDSRSNKVLVYSTENQKKTNQTPYQYLEGNGKEWSFDEYMNQVIELKDRKLISKAKMNKLLFREDITKIEVLKGFIARNINDTRYASRVVLNSFQKYFESKQSDTKVKVIRGSFTHQMRKKLQLSKNRDESYAHHAVDAMLICYSQMGYEAYRQLQEDLIDPDSEKIRNLELWKETITEAKYDEVLYTAKWLENRGKIQEAEKKVKFWHKVDSKANRALCNQTIRGTRVIDGSIQKINKINIYSVDGYKTFKNMIQKGKEKDFLMYRNDRRSWDDLMKVYREYSDAKNAFAAYQEETGDYVRKYAKKHNGSKITNLKYCAEKLGSCIDISHKYGLEKDSRKVILESLSPYRSDVYYNAGLKQYYIVGIKYSDLRFLKGEYFIDSKRYLQIMREEGVLTEQHTLDDLAEIGTEFQFSLYENDYLEYEKNDEIKTERFLSRTMPKQKNYIETKPIDAPQYENDKRQKIGLAKSKSIKKIRVDILGNRYYASKEKFSLKVDKF